MKKKYVKLTLGLSTLLMLLGCYPKENVAAYSKYDLVVTNYDKDFNYAAQTSFALPDSIILITDQSSSSTTKQTFLNQVDANLILNQITTNMLNMGWVKAKDSASASVIILPSAFQSTTVNYYYPYSYWGWYYPGYYPGYGWGYPSYGYPMTTTYQTGSLLMQMTYPNGVQESSVPVVWTGLINGLLNTNGSSSSSISTRVVTDINQSFSQSPYLNIKK